MAMAGQRCQRRQTWANARTILKEVFGLFGAGIHESLQRTMGKYMFDGLKSKENLSQWELDDSKHLLSHNNFAERPFAMVKALMKTFPSLKLSNAAAIASAKANGTHDEGGAALVCDPKLQRIINALCSVRQATPGAITLLLRGFLSADQALAKAHRISHRKNQEKVNMENAKGRAKKVNAAQEVTLHRTMPVIVRSLESFGEAKGHAGKKLAYLKQQFTGRIGIGYKYDNKNKIGMQYRSLSKPYQLVMEKKPPSNRRRKAPAPSRLPTGTFKANARCGPGRRQEERGAAQKGSHQKRCDYCP